MKNIIFSLVICYAFCSLNISAFEQVDVTIEKNSQHEECFFVNQQSSLSYQYKSSAAIDFNFHFHDDNGMNFIIELTQSTESKDTIKQLHNKQVYCLMWVNESMKPAELSYEFSMK